MQAATPPEITVQHLGTDREPVVIADGWSGDVEGLLAQARTATYRPGGAAYPGVRASADPAYLGRHGESLCRILGEVFGLIGTVGCESSAFSIVSTPPEALSPAQRQPHFDAVDPRLLAVMHYLQGPRDAGTAFYRHRRTGFEAITQQREAAYRAAQAEDQLAYGDPPPGYTYGDSDRYEMIGEVAAVPDRAVFYRGRLLHSGVIPPTLTPDPDPATGRVTINMFLVLTAPKPSNLPR